MKHLMRYEGFSPQERLDEILDKIHRYGIKSISKEEMEFLDSHKDEKEEELHKKLQFHESNSIFEDDNNYFRFELQDIEKYDDDELHLIGILYTPSINFENTKVEGRLEGRIVVYEDNYSPDFFKKEGKIVYDVMDFIEGLEHEFDIFLEYVVGEINTDL